MKNISTSSGLHIFANITMALFRSLCTFEFTKPEAELLPFAYRKVNYHCIRDDATSLKYFNSPLVFASL